MAMSIEEYEKRQREIRYEADMKIKSLNIEFAKENAPDIHKGDILFTNSGFIGKVDSRSVSTFGSRYPEAYYNCTRLTKKLAPNKVDPTINIFQYEIVKIRKESGEDIEFKYEKPK